MDERIADICQTAIDARTTPGMVVGYIRDDKTQVLPFGHLRYNRKDPVNGNTIYDVASITKSIPTACLALKLLEDGELNLDERVITYIPELQNQYREEILVKHLLTYTLVFDIEGGLSAIAKAQPHDLLAEMFKAPLAARPGERYYYTNPPAILLGLLLERLAKQTLSEQAKKFFEPLKMSHTGYQVARELVASVAPTEVTDKGELQGVVEDEAARALAQDGRVAGDAGLFTTAEDLLIFAQMLLNQGMYEGKQYFKPQTVELMHTNQISHLGARAGLGWELNNPQIMGSQVSEAAFGKTGFTGCNLVIDPKRNAALVILSNRTYPHREASRDDINRVRRAVAGLVFAPIYLTDPRSPYSA